MADEYDYLFKSIVVGDGGVGKTALTIRFSKGFFTEDYKMTIGVDFHVKTISIDTEEEGPIKVKLQIWDTGGQERFSSIRPMYYRGSLGGLLIFDLTSYESFEHLPQWIEEVRANIKSDIPLLLVGNKSDLVDQRAVSIEEIISFTNNFNLYYMETSAKTGEGVGDCFYILACLMVGSGVPDQLISHGIVAAPGQAISMVPSTPTEVSPIHQPEPVSSTSSLIPEPKIDFAAPPVPEPTPIIEPEPEIDFAAPPVPEPTPIIKPEPEIDFAAPPVPEPTPIIEPEPEIDFAAPPVPEPEPLEQSLTEKAPEEIEKPAFSIPTEISVSSETPTYKPKSVPFMSNVPVPAAPPEEFQTEEPASESLVDYMPETILSKKERKKLEKQRKKEEKERELQEKRDKAAQLKEKMQSVGKEEKEKAKLEKQRKKEEKERELQEKKEEKERELQEKRDKAAQLKEQMQSVKKEKKKEKEVPEVIQPSIPFQASTPEKKGAEAPNLFQTLSQKTDDSGKSPAAAFVPFSATETAAQQETSSLRIIPNVADLNKEQEYFPETTAQSGSPMPEIPSISPTQKVAEQTPRKDLIICQHCGAMLSSDYAFCNKCGAKL
ncbi:MAG: GTP-binding protein [Candidatus Hodarchaeota archaeon]